MVNHVKNEQLTLEKQPTFSDTWIPIDASQFDNECEQLYLLEPQEVPKEIYDLMREFWNGTVNSMND